MGTEHPLEREEVRPEPLPTSPTSSRALANEQRQTNHAHPVDDLATSLDDRPERNPDWLRSEQLDAALVASSLAELGHQKTEGQAVSAEFSTTETGKDRPA